MRKRAAFQGELGAFTQVAVAQLAGESAIPVPTETFEQVFVSLINGKCDQAVIPIENTLHGSVHENYDHLLKYNLSILGETFVRIVHNLIAPPGVGFGQVRRVFSHPVALNQCRRFFEENPLIERTTFYDTAGSVKMVMEEGLQDAAAIASAAAAKIYGGRILKKSIEDDRQNYTRFLLIGKSRKIARGANKTSIAFALKNVPGALFKALSVFALRDISLSRIESRPMRGHPWEYVFFVDMLRGDDEPARNALRHLAEVAEFVKVLGIYPAAKARVAG